jgi:hypothetical protein
MAINLDELRKRYGKSLKEAEKILKMQRAVVDAAVAKGKKDSTETYKSIVALGEKATKATQATINVMNKKQKALEKALKKDDAEAVKLLRAEMGALLNHVKGFYKIKVK